MSDYDLKGVLRTLNEFGSTFKKAGENPRPSDLSTVGDGLGTQPGLAHVLSNDDRLYLQRGLMQLNNQELVGLFAQQLNKGAGSGVPIAQAWSYQTMEAMGQDPVISKALDTSGGAALQRQDLEPILYPIFVRAFPAFDRLRKIPSNGVESAPLN